MRFAFQKMKLEANSLYSLISIWAEAQLVVTENSAKIIGNGYTYDIAGAFTALVFDWEATIHLPKDELGLEPGEYGLIDSDDGLYAYKDQQGFLVKDRPVVVEVLSVPEDEE